MLKFTDKFASKLGKWGEKWSPVQDLANQIWQGDEVSEELVQQSIYQLKSIRKWIWLDLTHPSFSADSDDLRELIVELQLALEKHRTSEAMAAFEQTKENYFEAFKKLTD